jgi:hypothetical protein
MVQKMNGFDQFSALAHRFFECNCTKLKTKSPAWMSDWAW